MDRSSALASFLPHPTQHKLDEGQGRWRRKPACNFCFFHTFLRNLSKSGGSHPSPCLPSLRASRTTARRVVSGTPRERGRTAASNRCTACRPLPLLPLACGLVTPPFPPRVPAPAQAASSARCRCCRQGRPRPRGSRRAGRRCCPSCLLVKFRASLRRSLQATARAKRPTACLAGARSLSSRRPASPPTQALSTKQRRAARSRP